MRTKYLDRAKDVLVVNLIKAIVSMSFGEERAKYASRTRTLALTLREIATAKTAIYDSVMPGYVAEKFEHVPGEVLLSICPYLENDPRIWDWLKESDRMRVRRLLETADVATLKTHAAFDAFAIDSLSAILLDRFNGFDETTKISIIAEHPRKGLVCPGIDLYAQAASYSRAEQLGESIILPLATYFTAKDLERVLKVASENSQIYGAGGTHAILKQLLDQTTSLLLASPSDLRASLNELSSALGLHSPVMTLAAIPS